jgi:transcriptional regulator with XRE-family HTH domain
MRVGSVLRRRRAELGLRQRQLAGVLGVTEDYLSLVERDLRTPSMEVLERWADALQVPVSYVVFESEQTNPALPDDVRAVVEDARRVAASLLRRIDELQWNERERETPVSQSEER